ncbi:hypothetical protein CO614_05055 [Lysobacteraceae bacterium NML120232]|nr:hypothetical protein CO614_05055 [Xanthomonadaceae bacterium NML120232]
MYWSLLPAAAVFFWLALRTPSVLQMLVWLFFTTACLLFWGWLHYRKLFPKQNRELQLTPLDRQQLEQLRQHVHGNGAQPVNAPAQTGITPPASTPTPSMPAQPAATQAPTPAPAATPAPTPAPVERPITGRAVFILPDDPPLPPGGGNPQP